MRLQMKTRVKKSDLTARITAAREQHQKQYEIALKGWIDKMCKAAEEVIERVKRDDLHAFPKEFKSLMDMPSLHLGDYDQALRMLEMSVDSEIELEPDDFDQLVLGNWSWREQWETTNSNYMR